MAAASTAALTAVGMTANAQIVPLEIEGPMSGHTAITPETGFLTVMGQTVYFDENTAMVTPTSDKSQTARPNNPNRPLTATQWFRGERFEGRNRPGFIGATVIITGYWDPAMNGGAGGVYAEEIFSDISENVILGVITEISASTRPAPRGTASSVATAPRRSSTTRTSACRLHRSLMPVCLN